MTTLKQIIEEAVREALDPVGKTEKGKKVGVGQIRDIDNDGDVDSSDEYLAYRRKKVSQAMKKERKLEEYKKSVSWGEIPDEEELDALMDGEPFDMQLQGADSLAFEYAMDVSDNPAAGSTSNAAGLHATLQALVDVPKPDELSDEQFDEVWSVLHAWDKRYKNDDIEETAWSLASSIMEVLGVEWI